MGKSPWHSGADEDQALSAEATEGADKNAGGRFQHCAKRLLREIDQAHLVGTQRDRKDDPVADTNLPVSTQYHVQLTVTDHRNGFPYFDYHESISRLWAEKWRPACQHSIYPFTDANVADFDPIFKELVRMTDDDPNVLYKPDKYAQPFLPAGQLLLRQAEQAEAESEDKKACNLYLRAAAVFRIGRFPINRSPVSQEAWRLGKDAYLKAGRYLTPQSVAVELPFGDADTLAGDRDKAIAAYLRMPTGHKPKNGWPVLLFICGLDAYRTDHTPRTQEHVNHGFATLSFEIPGTGDCPAAPNDPDSPDRLMSSVLDWVVANAEQYGFDTSKIVARGISTGGYYALRLAHTHAERLFGVVAQGGGCHHMFSPDWIRAQDQMEYPFALAEALAYKFGYRGTDPVKSYIADARKFSLLEAGILDLSNCKLLILNGMEDSIFPIEDSFIVAARGHGKDLFARGDRQHMGNPGAEDLLYSWIDNAVAGRP